MVDESFLQGVKILMDKRSSCIVQSNNIQHKRKELSNIKSRTIDGSFIKPSDEDIEVAKKLKIEHSELQAEITSLTEQIRTQFSYIPNLLSDIVPNGSDESDNEVVYEWRPEAAASSLEERVEDGKVLDHHDFCQLIHQGAWFVFERMEYWV